MRFPRSSGFDILPSYRAQFSAFVAAIFALIHPGPTALGDTKSVATLVASPEPGWPQFRGPRRDGISHEKGLLPSWPEGGPKTVWSATNLGNGYSSPVIKIRSREMMGDVGKELHLFALDLTGKQLWQAKNGAAWEEDYPGARASAAYFDGHVYHHNAHGRVACFDASNGNEVWALNTLEHFGGKNITWGLSECLLADDRAVYVTAGGSGALIVALDRKTGKPVWQSEPVKDPGTEQGAETPSYVSPILVDFAGRKLLVGCSLKHLFCVDAATGKLQWTKALPTRYSVLAMMPVLLGGNRIFMTAPHGTGGHCFELTSAGPGTPIGVKDVWTSQLDTCQGGVVYSNGRLFGSFYSDRKGWAVINAADGQVLYSNTDFVKGAVLMADGRLYALAEDGWMLLLEPTEKEFTVKGRFRLAEAARRDAWAHPVIL
ncbi:MAG TPA: PQQ-binding-like beta-propeller repeat protein, partial [Chthoniobacteraceae bacterium]|nr:PQQ-binding-like beta-propeller repeat protein [Chthoniobacteraceae bacterium]